MVALLIILSIFSLLLLFLFSPVRIHLFADSERSEVHVALRYLLIRKMIYPSSHTKKRKKSRTKKKAEEEKPKKPNQARKKESPLDTYREIRSLIATLLLQLPYVLKLRIRSLRLILASPDAAKTALLYGAACPSVSFLLEWMDGRLVKLVTDRGAVVVDCDFLSSQPRVHADLVFSVKPISLPRIFMRIVLPFIMNRRRKKLTGKATDAPGAKQIARSAICQKTKTNSVN